MEHRSCTPMVCTVGLWSADTIVCCVCYSPGVSHLTVPDDLAGIMAILDWLAFVPKVSHLMNVCMIITYIES